MSVAELLSPYIPADPVVYTRLAAIDHEFHKVFTQNKLWRRLNVYDLPAVEDGNNIFKHFLASMQSSNPLLTSCARENMCFLWDPEHHPRQMMPETQSRNLYALLGRWQPRFQNFYEPLGYPLYTVSKHFVLLATRLHGFVPFAFTQGMPLALYRDMDIFNAAIEYCGCGFKPFKSLRANPDAVYKALARGCRHQKGCFKNPFIYVKWNSLDEDLLEFAVRTGQVSVFEVHPTQALWRVYLEHQWKFKTASTLYDVTLDSVDGTSYVFNVPPSTFRMCLGPQPVRVRVARSDRCTLQRLAKVAPLLDWGFIEADTGISSSSSHIIPIGPLPIALTVPAMPSIPALPLALPTLSTSSFSAVANDSATPLHAQSFEFCKEPLMSFSRFTTLLFICIPVVLLVIYWSPPFNIYSLGISLT